MLSLWVTDYKLDVSIGYLPFSSPFFFLTTYPKISKVTPYTLTICFFYARHNARYWANYKILAALVPTVNIFTL